MFQIFMNPQFGVETELSATCTRSNVWTLDGKRVGNVIRESPWTGWTAYNESGKRLDSECSIAGALRAIGKHHAERERAAEKRKSAARVAQAALWHLYRYGA